MEAVVLLVVLMRELVSSERAEDAPTGWQERLVHNTTAVHQLLTRDEYSSVRERLSSVWKEKLPTCLPSDAESDAHSQWSYVLEGLSLLLCLKELLIEAGNQYQCERESAAPRALLSVSDNKVMRTLLQFIVTLGLYPYLLPGVGLPLSLRSNNPDESVTKVDSMVRERRAWHLYIAVVKVLVEVTEESASLIMSSIIFSTAFSDMLSALVQVCFAPPEKPTSNLSLSSTVHSIHTPADITLSQAIPTSGSDPCLLPSDREWCMSTLRRLLDRTHQIIVVRELLMMPQTSKERGGRVSKRVGSPAWLQRACCRLLSQRLMKKNGVLCVLLGILGAVSG